MFKRTLLVAIAICQMTAMAATPIDCVDPDVVNTLLGIPGQGPTEITRELPSDFPPINVPGDFQLIGGRAGPHFGIASFKTVNSTNRARTDLIALAVDSGWQALRANRESPRGGFQATEPSSVREAASLCHDRHGQLTALFSDAPSGAYVVLMASPGNPQYPCAIQQGRAVPQIPPMPVLNLPPNAVSTQQGARLNSNGYSATTSIDVETSLSSAELLAFFEQQLSDLGWRQEGSWIGRTLSGAGFVSDEEQSGLFTVVKMAESSYRLGFELIRHGDSRIDAVGTVRVD